jgi:F-box protein 18 (helicase)
MDDFYPLAKGEAIIDPVGVDLDEFNLIYVAVTRARINLRFHRDSSIPIFVRLWQKEKNITG